MLDPTLARGAASYLQLADRLLPGQITGFYLVGSAALGAFRPGRSDIDFIAVLDAALDRRELRRLRVAHLGSGVRSTVRALAAGDLALPGTCNGVYVPRSELAKPVSRIRPAASHTGPAFNVGSAFDVNPVVWKVFHERGIALRGPQPAELGLDPEPHTLRKWNLDNLNGYWTRWADMAARGQAPVKPLTPSRWVRAWGVLGAPRLHRTVATGEVISKEEAGAYALETFGPRWKRVVDDALAYWRGEPEPAGPAASQRLADAGAFMREVVRSANAIGA
ncbi:MAG: hypothetical protein AVDCRST_MAG50-1780 [uncultured Acidimicrobiales bacterium]|uniref:Adenylyltransferase AadA C-terminal domain-containing protein n=1 Tax=uncultured Acidimicrobiales bacterium TaxID=310071 RepID=A0A6J4I907_9ACTN|nr:MAG: hypothetical protein AVDCRST_MAG50-1780 [uncultured Acidimicrobiales bacterium]